MSYKLFLDDVRYPSDVKWVEMPNGPWVTVRNYSDFVKYMKKQGINSNGIIHLEYNDCGGIIYEKITINNGVVKTKTLHSLDIWELLN